MNGTANILVSAGELLDKLTIIEIKIERISCAERRGLVEREHSMLTSALRKSGLEALQSHELFELLKNVNQQLWDVEDEIRTFEAKGRFGETFVALARSVYRLNDQRSAVKRKINDLVGSAIREVKEYSTDSVR